MNNNLGISSDELISKEKTINVLTSIMTKLSIEPDIQSQILVEVMEQESVFDVSKV